LTHAPANGRFANPHQPNQHDRARNLWQQWCDLCVHDGGGYTQGHGIGQKTLRTNIIWVKCMSRLIKWGCAVVVIAGILFFLQSRVSEQPLSRHETSVSVDALK
jgi:hypothetical protein